VNVLLSNLYLTVGSANGPGQGSSVYLGDAQNSGTIYWEYTWTQLDDPALVGGFGLCTKAGVGNYAALAVNGTGGCILQPNGDIWFQQAPGAAPPPFNWFALSQGDMIGFYVTFSGQYTTIRLLAVGPSKSHGVLGIIFVAPDNYVPCAVFGNESVFETNNITANFGADPKSLLGPTEYPDFGWEGVTLGWPIKGI
jgi:hypothetical protein